MQTSNRLKTFKFIEEYKSNRIFCFLYILESDDENSILKTWIFISLNQSMIALLFEDLEYP
jgi:hypothetical protein